MLDAGCGAGSITIGLAERITGGHVLGIDLEDGERTFPPVVTGMSAHLHWSAMGKGRYSRGWELSKQSWNVIEADKVLLVLPLLSCLATVAVAVPVFAAGAYFSSDLHSNLWFLVACAAAFYPLSFISTFFGVAFVSVARRRLVGEPASVRDGLRAARQRLGVIAAWALLSTAVALVIQALQHVRVGGLAARIAEWLAGAAWALATFFVIPIIALEGVGPIDATRRSGRIIRERWGEGVVGSLVIGAIFSLLGIPMLIVGVIGFSTFSSAHVAGGLILAVAVVLFVLVTSAQNAVTQLFRLELFEYATAGAGLGVFDEEELESAFQERRRRLLSVPKLPAVPLSDQAQAFLDEREVEDVRLQLVDDLRRVGLVGPSGLAVRPSEFHADEQGTLVVMLRDDYGERWDGPAAEALDRLRHLPAHAGEDRFWLTFRS